MKIKGAKHWLWRAIDEYGAVLDVLLQEHRDTERLFEARLSNVVCAAPSSGAQPAQQYTTAGRIDKPF